MTDFNLLINKLNSSIEEIELQAEKIVELEKNKEQLKQEKSNLINDTLKIKQKIQMLIKNLE